MACRNKRVTEGIIRRLLEYFPAAASATDSQGFMPLHDACWNRSATLNIIRLLLEAAPETVRSSSNSGWMPIHALFMNETMDEATVIQILKLLIEKCPEAVRHADDKGLLPLHHACDNKSATLNIIQILIDAAPASVSSLSTRSWMPLHCLCYNREVDERAAIQILKLLIEKCPEAVRYKMKKGNLPIHLASEWRSSEFCQVLIEAYPGSERMSNAIGALPLHFACLKSTVDVVGYFLQIYPEAIYHATSTGHHPIHYAICHRNGLAALDVMQFLLDCNPNVKLQEFQGESLLHYACREVEHNISNIEASVQIIKVIFDAHPEAIECDRFASDIRNFHQQVQVFINGELVYARQARDHRRMTTPDDKGQLPLHEALQNNATLGSIKLLVKGNADAIQCQDDSGTLPLHVACQHYDSTDVIDYLVGLDTASLYAVDRQGDTALHCACRGAKYDAIGLLIEKYDAVSVSKRNAQNNLPIELLWESNAVEDREGVGYTESIFRLLKSYPEMFMTNYAKLKQRAVLGQGPSRSGKKRKCGNT